MLRWVVTFVAAILLSPIVALGFVLEYARYGFNGGRCYAHRFFTWHMKITFAEKKEPYTLKPDLKAHDLFLKKTELH